MEKRWKRRRHGARQRSEHRSRFIRPSQAVRVTDTLFFTADHPDTGRELWQSDGTEAGTALVSDIVAGAGTSSPASLTRVGGTLFFTARHPTLGRELWKVDQSSGAVLVKDINLGPASSEPTRLTAFNDTLYFQAGHQDTGRELWKSDGTEAGTVLVKDIWPGPSSGGPGVGGGSQFVSLNDGTLIFPAFHPDTGHELWKSDGTEAGTMLVRDINPGRANSSPEFPINVAGTIFFGAFRPDIGVELWKSDGTEAGTALVKDINPGPGHSRPALVASVNAMAVFSAFEPDTGHEFWRSDGTEAGTTVIHEIVPGPGSPQLGGLFNPYMRVSDAVVFVADDGVSGFELWRTDGVTLNLLSDINPGPASSLTRTGFVAQPWGVAGGLVMFSAADGVHGLEFWASDGWSAARLVNDIAVGAGSSEPNLFTAVGPLVFFGANDNRTGGELWAITRAALHRAFNLPDSINDVEAEQESSPGRFNRTDGCSDDLLCAEFMEDDAGRDNVYKEGI